MKRFIHSLAILFFVVFAYPLSGQTEPIRKKCTVTYIVDGDTFYGLIDNGTRTKFRLIGIDTPESKHPNKPVEPFSKEAADRLNELIGDQEVWLEYDIQEKDRYGRSLVYVFNQDNIFINEILVEEGLAQVTTFPPNIRYVELFTQAQKRARESNIGLWQY